MALRKVQLIPGFDKQVTETGAEGRWTGGQYVRFRYGLPEKIGGWSQKGATSLVGVARDQHTWFDLSGNRYAAIGTDKVLYIYYEGTFYDIHPLDASKQKAGMTNCFTTTNGSPTVTVSTGTGHGLEEGDLIVFSSVSAIPGSSGFTAADFTKTFEVKPSNYLMSFISDNITNEYVRSQINNALSSVKLEDSPRPTQSTMEDEREEILCPACKNKLIFVEGCNICIDCGYSGCTSG